MKLTLIPAMFCFISLTACRSPHTNPLASDPAGADMSRGGIGGNGADNGGGGGGVGGSGNDGGAAGNSDAAVASGGDAGATGGGDAGATGGGDGGVGSTAPSPFIDTAAAIHAFMTFDYKVTVAQIPQIAPHIDFVWGANSSKVTAWHAGNPKTYVTYYIPFNQDPGNQSLSWWQANHPDWVLYQCDRKTPATASGYPNIDLDFSNPAVQAWQLGIIKTAQPQGYDGVAFDLFSIDNVHRACGIYRNGQWVQLYTGNYSDPQFATATLGWLRSTYTSLHALPKQMGLVPNFTLGRSADDPTSQQILANVDAILDEDTWGNWGSYTTDGTWFERVKWIEQIQAAGKGYYEISAYPTLDTAAVQWSLASYLMAKEHHAAVDFGDYQSTNFGSDPMLPEYSAAIGPACGAMTATQKVYTRSFAHGLAIVNPSANATVPFTLPSSTAFRDLYGNAVSGTVTLAPHSGMVLFLVGTSSC